MKRHITLRCIGVRGEKKKKKKNDIPIKPFTLGVVKGENKQINQINN